MTASSGPASVAPTMPTGRAGTLTVADLLDLPVVQRGRPVVLAGSGLERREVRWVHTSEIYEIFPLLKGGEVLLTTGLGLVGASPSALRRYAIRLAERSVAALVLELGRTFTSAPEALVAGAEESGLPLIVLRGVVPFIEITESVHSLLLSDEVTRLRQAERIADALTPALLSGAGLIALLRTLAEVADCPARLYAEDGHLVAAADDRGDLEGAEGAGREGPTARVELFGRPWGALVLAGTASAFRRMVCDRGAVAVALELGRAGAADPGAGRRRAGARLLREIFGRQYSSADELIGRAAALGVAIRPGQQAVGICLAVEAAPALTAPAAPQVPGAAPVVAAAAPAVGPVVAAAAERLFGAALVAEIDGSHLIAICTECSDPRALMTRLADAVDHSLGSGRAIAVTFGPPVGDIASLARSLRTAREASVLARRLHSELRILLASDLGVHRLLGRFAADPELAAFVDEQLGPLLDHDAARGRELVRTLDTLLACGLSKAAAARALGIRRQSMYQRLETISALLGGLDLSSRERRTAIDLALVGWRLRSAAAGSPPVR